MPTSDFLALDPRLAPARGLADWLTASLRDAARDGRLRPGDRLPATRALAVDLGIARSVVVEAYGRLADEALVESGPRRGTVVRAGVAARPPVPRRAAGAAEETRPVDIDLSPNVPDLSLFPRAAWVRAEREVLHAPGGVDLGYGDPAGMPALRDQLARWLARMRGLQVDPAQIVIVSGVAQALALLATVQVRAGQGRVAVEDPGSRGAIAQLAYWGADIVPVPTDDDGIEVDAVAAARVDAVLVTPAHQFPIGVVLSPDRRRALLDWARDSGGLIIEDDYDADQRYDRAPVPALHASAPHLVAYAGSASKSLAPALRLGWLIVPDRMRESVVAAKYASDIASSVLPQAVLARLIENGAYEQCLRRARARQRARRDAMVSAVGRRLPAASVRGVAAGLHLTLTFEDAAWLDVDAARRLEALGVRVDPLSRHRTGPGAPGFVIGYAAHTPGRIDDAVARIADGLRTVS